MDNVWLDQQEDDSANEFDRYVYEQEMLRTDAAWEHWLDNLEISNEVC